MVISYNASYLIVDMDNWLLNVEYIFVWLSMKGRHYD